ncbi:hypothetical protein CGW93_04125 [candidate division bacterium WOR-3 4484_18]|uniref:Uncharacterized protein n=1 Tax=candidate division WOR-3 bacterium 4484_18 TaxID=2020626 RepID=A0A257LTF8_UNCW3|nr:MAG: hypothetical protein CGW93_04125 [candidate division bacterium WOR-3 4484_18]
MLDNPHNNSKAGIHTYPVPSVGGIAVVIAVMVGIWLRYGRFEAWNHIPFYLTVLIPCFKTRSHTCWHPS